MAWEFDIPEINLLLVFGLSYVLISRGKFFEGCMKYQYTILPTIRTI
jgi:hypothetical protein